MPSDEATFETLHIRRRPKGWRGLAKWLLITGIVLLIMGMSGPIVVNFGQCLVMFCAYNHPPPEGVEIEGINDDIAIYNNFVVYDHGEVLCCSRTSIRSISIHEATESPDCEWIEYNLTYKNILKREWTG